MDIDTDDPFTTMTSQPVPTPPDPDAFDLEAQPGPVLVDAAREELSACVRSRAPDGCSVVPWLRRTALPGIGDVFIAITWAVPGTMARSSIRIGRKPSHELAIYSSTRRNTTYSATVAIVPFALEEQIRVSVTGCGGRTTDLRGKFGRDGSFRVKAPLEVLSPCVGGRS